MNLGLQLYTVRDAFGADPFGTLERVSAMGYKNVEFANHRADQDPGVGFDVPAAKLRQRLAELEMHALGCHVIPLGDDRNLDAIIAYHEELGTESLAIGTDFFKDRDDVLRRSEFYNEVGEKCRAAGIKFYYHTHWHEFQRVGSEMIIDVILANTDPKVVSLEMDAYWTIRGLLDPVAFIHQYGDRIDAVHQKDFPLAQIRSLDVWAVIDRDTLVTHDAYADAVFPDQFIEVGDGIMKIQDIIDAALAYDVSYYIVELDYGVLPDQLDRAQRSIDNLKRMHGLTWRVPRRVAAGRAS
jgi:sugar phosphate isomerase/epimerase